MVDLSRMDYQVFCAIRGNRRVSGVSPSPEHEALHRIFTDDTALFARAVARALNVEMAIPADVSELSVDFTEFRPVVERRADTALHVKFKAEDTQDDYILIVESQTNLDDTRRASWPYYTAFVQSKYKCDVVLLVVCSKAATARWARTPIVTGLPGLPCQVTTPVVLGPDNVPVVTTVEEAAADLHFAVFSALTHSRGPEVRGILELLATALGTTDTDTAEELAEFTEAGLGDTPGLQIWRALMATETFPYVSQMRARGRAEGEAIGEARGEAKSILRVLKRRKVAVDQAARERIESCTDLKTLGTWLDRSLDVATVADLFKD
jgi:hypothetical protein